MITSAGIILAGTFSVLMTLPVTFTFDLGFMVALGILLDTFVVRTIMVPAAVELIGDRMWWPSTAQGGGRGSSTSTDTEESRPRRRPGPAAERGVKPAHVGCSGWNYPHWRGSVYPEGVPQSRWLEHYATLFDTVEVNATFYRLPKRETVATGSTRRRKDSCSRSRRVGI